MAKAMATAETGTRRINLNSGTEYTIPALSHFTEPCVRALISQEAANSHTADPKT
jgi:hypothetical protein